MNVLEDLERQMRTVWNKYQELREKGSIEAQEALSLYRKLWINYKRHKLLFENT